MEGLIAAGSFADVSMLPYFRFDLPPGSRILGDKAYNDYDEEDFLKTVEIYLSPARKTNSHRTVSGCVQYVRNHARKTVETAISVCEQAFPKSIHAVPPHGFELKVFLFVLAFSVGFVL